MSDNVKILMIDDDVDYTTAIKAVLETKSYEVIVANNGDEGLRLAEEKQPHLILLDVIMPVKSGFSVAEELKKNPRLSKIPTLMLTAFADKRGGSGVPVSNGLLLDSEDYIDKTVGPEELLERIKPYVADVKN